MTDRRGAPGATTLLWLKRLAWFVGLWCASVLALGVVAWGIRSLIL
ncbi:DUF2474 domain-containing protein [Mangrovibrevibacter kandeliae]|nr:MULTISPECIES: DUF2474 domain-containing protein [unclassified Aurantimonas]MCQ8783651.1 DUF2474 domain-containing protein [Aurantimonas sp. CSK15Z-1]MCW4116386.1 DUF2474 domain-containing protein [Aurantimonas sp. MSK8Z-1]